MKLESNLLSSYSPAEVRALIESTFTGFDDYVFNARGVYRSVYTAKRSRKTGNQKSVRTLSKLCNWNDIMMTESNDSLIVTFGNESVILRD